MSAEEIPGACHIPFPAAMRGSGANHCRLGSPDKRTGQHDIERQVEALEALGDLAHAFDAFAA